MQTEKFNCDSDEKTTQIKKRKQRENFEILPGRKNDYDLKTKNHI